MERALRILKKEVAKYQMPAVISYFYSLNEIKTVLPFLRNTCFLFLYWSLYFNFYFYLFFFLCYRTAILRDDSSGKRESQQ